MKGHILKTKLSAQSTLWKDMYRNDCTDADFDNETILQIVHRNSVAKPGPEGCTPAIGEWVFLRRGECGNIVQKGFQLY